MGNREGMDLHVMLLKLTVEGVILAAIAVRAATAQGMPGSQDRCGNLSIPYPFGMREGCYLNESFFITCTNSKPYLNDNLAVLNISLYGHLRVTSPFAFDCYDEQGHHSSNDQQLTMSWFPLSSTRNKFTAVGCNTIGIIQVFRGLNYTTGCMSLSRITDNIIDASCSGMAFCQSFIPKGVKDFTTEVKNFFEHKGIWNVSTCSFAFVKAEEHNDIALLYLDNYLRESNPVPMVLEWAVGDTKCKQAQKNQTSYLCQENSVCYDWDEGPGYRCHCYEGYHGNPYLPDGCRDVNECDHSKLNDCTQICNNTAGSYTCLCPKNHLGDGKKCGKDCISDLHRSLQTKATVGMSISFVLMLVIISFLHWGIWKRKIIMRKAKFFKQNGGIILELLLSNCKREGSDHKAKVFTEAELKKATNDFSDANVIGQGGYGTVYKGTLANDMVVAIKKSKVVDRGQIKQFINEIIVLSQIKHPNVVKLLGCCLETPVAMLVYKFITNHTLFHHVHDEGHVSSMPWEMRMRIAAETAEALAYMHSAPIHIIHRDVKSANILLDEDYTAKVSDFGVSRLVPSDQTQLPTLVQGTFGYLDPEYFYSGVLTKKSDVYGFGVILIELLTGKKVISLDKHEEDKGLASYFISSLEEDRLFQILEDRVKKEGHAEQLKGVAEVAKKCLRLKGHKRPTMKEVKEELEALKNFKITHES